MIKSTFNSEYTIRFCDFDYVNFLNQGKYEVIETLQYDLNVPKLYPVISLYAIINKLSLGNNESIGNIDLICNNDRNFGRIAFTKLKVLHFLFQLRNQANLLAKVTFSNNLTYLLSTGIIKDEQQNTLLCFCFDITKVDFVSNKILEGGIYLMMDIKRLSTPEHKQLLSIINSKGSIMDMCIEENIDVILTDKIDRKLFTVFNKEFTSITDRKAYLQEKAKLLMEQDIENVVI